MKIRIKDNSVRLRLTQSEVTELYDNGVISRSTQFLDKPFEYAVERFEGTDLSADFIDNRITMKIPVEFLEELKNTDTVGFDGISGQVKLLIEKDFVCIDNTDEDQSDNYPNPNLKC